MPFSWDEETQISSKDEISLPTHDRGRAYLIVLAGNAVGEMYKISKEMTVIGRGPQVDIHVLDEGISRRHAELVQRDENIVIRDLGSTNGTYCNGKRIKEHLLSDGDKIQVGSTTILKFTFHDSLDESFQRQMYEAALRDSLTKIFNKKYFLDRLESEFAYASRHQTPLSLILFDVDLFKNINDTYGHLAGDFALASLAKIVSEAIRSEDVFARYGGEEFGVICRGIPLPDACLFAERIRQLVAERPFVHNNCELRITVSLGVAAFGQRVMHDALELIRAADEALYKAKRSGRNRVVIAGERPDKTIA